jgi:protoheme IX farnesyltransferase
MNTTVLTVRSTFGDLLELTKPRINLLVLVTTFSGMWLAAGGSPALKLVFATLLGTGLAAAASAVLNNYIDRDVDARMARTAHRALPSGRIDPNIALQFGFVLGAVAIALLFFFVNALSAALAAFTIGFYVLVYTRWLKRTSPWCTEIGGVAGALPAVIGWAAVTNSIGWPALAMFLILFIWQPPHFWALALLRCDEYRRAGLPMLPVARGVAVTKARMLLYTLILVPVTLLMYSLHLVGVTYLAFALALGALYIGLTIAFVRLPLTAKRARRLFAFSIIYLLVLFYMMFVDCRCGGGL